MAEVNVLFSGFLLLLFLLWSPKYGFARILCKMQSSWEIHSFIFTFPLERTNNKRSPSSLYAILLYYLLYGWDLFTLNAGNRPNHIFTTHHRIHINYILYWKRNIFSISLVNYILSVRMGLFSLNLAKMFDGLKLYYFD